MDHAQDLRPKAQDPKTQEVWLLVFTFSIYLLAVVVDFFNCFVGRAPLLRRGSNIITPPMPGFCCSDIVWLLLQTPSGSSVLGPRGNFERPLFFVETKRPFFCFCFCFCCSCFVFIFVLFVFCFVLFQCCVCLVLFNLDPLPLPFYPLPFTAATRWCKNLSRGRQKKKIYIYMYIIFVRT